MCSLILDEPDLSLTPMNSVSAKLGAEMREFFAVIIPDWEYITCDKS